MVRVGPRMSAVVSFVARNPGRPMLAAAEYVGPHGSLCYGYRAVHRVIAAGLVETKCGPRGATLLFPIGPCVAHEDCLEVPELGAACAGMS